jgi:DNA modification methylase
MKRALTNVGGPAERRGEESLARELARAVDVQPGAGLERWTHGFHAYAARLHPDTARRCLRCFASPGCTVLDPFCGSGTVIVEALVAGCRATGRDLNPLAVRLARLRAALTTEEERRALRERAHRVGGVALERVRRGVPAPVAPGIPAAPFPPGVRAELAWLRFLASAERRPFVADALELTLSSLLPKVAERSGATGSAGARRGAPPGAVCRMFASRAGELVRCLAAFRRAVPRDAPPPDVRLDDARTLGTVPDASADLVLTSPPYPNVYDYAAQHALRAAWLRLDDWALRRGEIGARRTFLDPRRGLERWEADGRAWTTALARVMKPGSLALIAGGDGASPLGPLRFDECLERWAPAAGLRLVAAAAQRRPAFDPETRRAFRDRPRREHLVALRRPERQL